MRSPFLNKTIYVICFFENNYFFEKIIISSPLGPPHEENERTRIFLHRAHNFARNEKIKKSAPETPLIPQFGHNFNLHKLHPCLA
jgi:hypothetical protein